MADVGDAIVAGIFGLVLLCVGMISLAIAVQDYVYNDFFDWTVNILGFLLIAVCLGLSGVCFIGAWCLATEPE
jgi:hypothetical protein